MIVGAFSAPFFLPAVPVLILFLVPLVLDGGIQLLTPYESTNGRRLVTGILFGYALTGLFCLSTAYVFSWGMSFGRDLSHR